MKHTYLLLLLAAVLLQACDNNEFGEVNTPNIKLSYSPQNPQVGDTVTFTIESDANFLSIFTGDSLHDYDYSKIRYEMEYGISTFEDTVYRRRSSPDNSVYRAYMKDYNSVQDVLKDISFWGAIDEESIELAEFDPPGGSVVESSHPKQLKFTIKDRRVPSGFSFYPDVHLPNRLMYLEMRLVCDSADYFVRFGEGRNNKKVTSAWRLHYYDVIDKDTFVAGTNPADFTDYQDEFYPNYEYLPNADSTFNPLGFLNDWEFNCSMTNDPMLPPNGTLQGAKREFNDLVNRHSHRIHPLADDQLDASEYSYYSYKNHPERARVAQADVLIGGSIYSLWQDPETTLSGYDEETGFPRDKTDWGELRNFQGDVYLTAIEWGFHTYLPYDEGQSIVKNQKTSKTTFKYVYTEDGDFTISVVGTNTGGKLYSGSGYQDQREYKPTEYSFKRKVEQVDLTVNKQ